MASQDFDRALDRLVQDANFARREARNTKDLGSVVERLAKALDEFATKLKEEEQARSRAQPQT
jgi:hypothetical protein